MEFQPVAESDLPGPEWLQGIEFYPDQWRGQNTRAIWTLIEGEIVALGLLWTSRVHSTDRYWAEVTVDPSCRRQGIGRATIARLASLRVLDLPLMNRGYVDDERAIFADALGARTIQVVPPVIVDVSSRTALRSHERARSASEVPLPKVLEAYARIYQWVHASWSPVGPDFAEALTRDMATELDFEASSVVIDDKGEILALADSYIEQAFPSDVAPGQATAGTTSTASMTAEATNPDDPRGERWVEACIRRSLDELYDRGVTTVEFDGHVTDPHFMPVLARLNPRGRWFRLFELPLATVKEMATI